MRPVQPRGLALALAILASQIFVTAASTFPAHAEPTGIILYSTSNWTGESLTVHEPTITNLGEYGWNDKVRSFTVTGGSWLMYRDENFDGNKGHDVAGPFQIGNHTFGDCSDCFSAQATSILRIPETGITLFEHTRFRGHYLNSITSVPRLVHAHDIDTGFLGLAQVIDPVFAWGDAASSWAINSGTWWGYDHAGYRGYSGNFNQGGLHNDELSSMFLENDRGWTEVTSVDDRLERPRNTVALDSGNWGATAVTSGTNDTLRLPANRGIGGTMDIRLNGFSGTYYTTCGGIAMFHTQHIVRLPNSNGRAYFAVTMSDKSADLDAAAGFWLVFRLDDDAYDASTDRFIDTPGTDGEYVWSQRFTAASPFGDWNHPGKMAVLGGVLVMAAEQWSSTWCDAYIGSSADHVLFYDVRDPEQPRFWGALSADQLDVNSQDREVLGDPLGITDGTRRVINTVTLDQIGGDIVLGVGGNSNRKLFKAKGGKVAPHPAAWELIGESSDMSNSHGANFNSLELGATTTEAQPGVERIVFFDGSIRECSIDQLFPAINCLPGARSMFASSVLFRSSGGGPTFTVPAGSDVKASRGAPGAGGAWTWPIGGSKSEDASSMYVTAFQQPVIYIPEVSWDAQPWPSGAPDDINGQQVIPALYSLQKNPEDGPSANGESWGYFNRFYQVHLPEPATRVTSASDSDSGSLRTVIAELLNGGVIDFDPALDGAVIELTSGQIEILREISIDASTLPSGITISGASSSRVFSIDTTGSLVLNNITISNGRAPASSGGGLLNEGNLELLDCTVTGNTAVAGGGIWNEGGRVTLMNTTVSGNGATNSGGGIGNFGDMSSLEITRSTISTNTASNNGSGIAVYSGQIEAINSTVSGNTETGGGGIWAQGDTFVSLTHCTIDNEVDIAAASVPASMLNTIAKSVVGDISTRGANLFGSHAGLVVGGRAPTINPFLGVGALADNGGSTRTQSPQSGSPAIDTGTYLRGVSSEDQRQAFRGSIPDIGAVETPDLNLEFLTLTSAPLTPRLSPSVPGYSASVSFGGGETAIGALPAQPSAIVEVSLNGGEFVPTTDGSANGASEYLPIRPLSLNVGANTIAVRTRAADPAITKTLTIAVTREPASSDANLSFLATDTMSLDPVFDSAITSYDAGVTSAKNFRLWGEARTSVASVEVRVNGGDYYVVPPATSIAAGNQHSLAIREGVGTIAAWGSNRDLSGAEEPANQGTVDGTVVNAVAVSGGDSHTLALETTGHISAWGSDVFGQTSVPPHSGGLAVAAGANHSLALVSTGGGRVIAWGDNSVGQATVPAAAQSGVIRIAAGDLHSLALKNDGTVLAWGGDFDDQVSGMPGGLSDVVAIAAGFTHSLALKSDGTVVRWGEQLSGGLSDVPSDLTGVVSIAAGDGVSLALKGNGEIVAWGGLADCEREALVSGATAIAVGRAHRLAVRGNHSLIAWGSNNAGQTEVPMNLVTPMPTSPLLALAPGTNTIEVRVTAENGTTKTYSVSIEQDDAAEIDTFDPAPSSLDTIFVGSKRYFRNITLIGQRVHYRVTGSAAAGSIWGTDTYTLDSNIATTAVHAGVLADGEEGIVTLTIVPAITNFVGTDRNGVLSKNSVSINPDPPTAITIEPFTGDPFAYIREQYSVENGPPPLDLRCHGSRLGDTLKYLVVGSAPADPDNPESEHLIWYQAANDRYSHDSSLATAAVHAGVVEAGQTGVVAVTVGPGFSFQKNDEQADTAGRNGVIPSKRGDNHSSFVSGSFTVQSVVGFGLNDSDGDGLSDDQEALVNTDPDNPDSDGDGMLDAWELDNGLDPLVDDSAGDDDEDGLTNVEEFNFDTDPQDPDTDDDLLPDAWEVEHSLNATVNDALGNADGDMFTNLEEYQNGTDPMVWDPPISVGPVCGDGVLEAPEECDDGNASAGDCCSAICGFESNGALCAGDGNDCTDDRCDGSGTCTHPANSAGCDDGEFCNGPDSCSAGACTVHDGDPCVGSEACADTCNEIADNCFVAAETPCADDADICTADQCDGTGSCEHSARVEEDCDILCSVAFKLADTTTQLGALQWEVGYADAPGDFAGAAKDVDCIAANGAAGSFFENSGTQTLTAEVTAAEGLSDAQVLASCAFNSTTSLRHAAGFTATAVAAHDVDGISVPTPAIEVEVECQVCGAPITGSSPPKATDCLGILVCAVGLDECARCIADINGSGSTTATDALGCLSRAVGRDIPFACECEMAP